MAGLEVEEIRLVGLPILLVNCTSSNSAGIDGTPTNWWSPPIDEVMPHPNADRLVLCRLIDGQQEHVVLTGAPNLFEFKGKGPLPKPLKVAYAKEGAHLYDGHATWAGADYAQARQNPRDRILFDGLLGEGTGHFGRT